MVGEVVDEHAGMVVVRTGFGGRRVLDMLVGDALPRIC
jgi:hydrogenase expression/formation protein HypE